MRFSGRLQIEADPHNWLKADLMVARGRVELVSGSELLGSWSTSQVGAERVEADRFSLQLGEDRALFIADDALSFSYEAMPQLNKRQLLPVGGVMDKLKAGLRGDDSREPAVVTPPAGVAPSESPMATTGKKLRELIREASGYSTTMEATTTESAPEKKGGHTLDAVLRWRSGAKDESRLASEDLEGEGETDLSTDDLLERLFDAPDAADHNLLGVPAGRSSGERQPHDDQSITGSLWAEPIAVPQTATPVIQPTPVAEPSKPESVPEPPAVVPPIVETPAAVAPPVVETWQKELTPLEVWHKADLSPNPDPQWGSSMFGKSTWPSSFDADPSASQFDDVIAALNLIVADVKSGAMSPEQVDAISSLVAAITKSLQLKL
ncbi:MAG TPA: hypothetical protein VFY46_07495 [Acidimicrobiia bacterium]|nr:hypothetical protein [Acidimicrobiia bacterium]